MPTNYGLLNDFTQGIKEGLIGLQAMQNQKRQEKQFNALHNLQQDEQGNLQLDETGQKLRAAQIAEAEAKAQKARGEDLDTKVALTSKGLIQTPEGGLEKTPEQKAMEDVERRYKEAQIVSLMKEKPQNDWKNLDKPKQILAENYTKDIAKFTTIKSQIDELKGQVGNKQIPEKDRLATAQEQLKLLNSTLGADAVGAEEVKRLASYLQYAPDPTGPKGFKFGPDLDGFVRQLERISERTGGTMGLLDEKVKEATGKSTGVVNMPKKGLVSQNQTKQMPKFQVGGIYKADDGNNYRYLANGKMELVE